MLVSGNLGCVHHRLRQLSVKLGIVVVWVEEKLLEIPRNEGVFRSAPALFLASPYFGCPSLMSEGYAAQFRDRMDQPRNLSVIDFFRLR
jgi:hypothetical protein